MATSAEQRQWERECDRWHSMIEGLDDPDRVHRGDEAVGSWDIYVIQEILRAKLAEVRRSKTGVKDGRTEAS